MANCFEWCKSRNKPARDVKLVIIGLDDAGKTTTVACLEGEPPDGITPTLGFANSRINLGKWNLTLYDLGGGPNVRAIWKRYFAEIYGVVFTVDSGNPGRLMESRDVLAEVCENTNVKGKPVLVFANKQDKEDAMDKAHISEELQLEQLSTEHNMKYNVFPCSALKGYGKQIDKSIQDGLRWLLSSIGEEFDKLHERVVAESGIQKEIDDRERAEKKARVAKIKAERALLEKEAGLAVEEEEDEDVAGPFRTIKEQIEITERNEKKAKEKRKKIEEYQRNKAAPGSDNKQADGVVPTTTPRKKKKKKLKKVLDENVVPVEDDVEPYDSPRSNIMKIPSISILPATPDIAKVKKKKKKPVKKLDDFENEYEDDDGDGSDEDLTPRQKVKKKKKEAKSDNDADFDNLSTEDSAVKKKKKNNKAMAHSENDAEDYDAHTDNIDNTNVVRKKKKKKKPVDASRSDDLYESMEEISSEAVISTPRKKKKKKKILHEDQENPVKTEAVDRAMSQEEINSSRAELFRAKDSIGLKEEGECDDSTGCLKKVKAKAKKKKANRTAPAPGEDALESMSTSAQNGIGGKAGRLPQLEPMGLNNRQLPDIGGIDGLKKSVPPWARARPNSEDADIMF